jgi:hypothetical protein
MSINYNDLFQTAVLLIQYKGEKTITPKVIQYAFMILYLKNNLSKKALSNASKYTIYFTSYECSIKEFKKASKFKKLLKKYLDTDGKEIYQCDFRISSNVPIYLCGLDDVFDNTYEEQYNSLGKPKENKNKKTKKVEPVPEDIINIDEDDSNEDENDEEYYEEIEENLVLEPIKTRSKTRNSSV